MRMRTLAFLLCVVSISSTILAENLSTTLSNKVANPSVYFLSAGSFITNERWRYRVSLSTVTIYPKIVIEKVTPEGEYEGEGDYEKDFKAKVAWSRILTMPFDVSPPEFAQSFKWRSTTSFSFMHENTKYIVEKIDDKIPQIKKLE